MKTKTKGPAKQDAKAVAEDAMPAEIPAIPGENAAVPERWPKECLKRGEWIQVPKVLLLRFSAVKLEPQHLLLLLVLQADRFRDRPHRYYWQELADLCGCRRNTVRRWGYELRDKGLLEIIPTRQVLPGEERQVGRRNERNIFDLGPLEATLAKLQVEWEVQRRAKRRRKPTAGAA